MKFAISVACSSNVTVSDNTLNADKFVFYDMECVEVKGNKVVKGEMTNKKGFLLLYYK
ncbi:MAG: hypothetical protein MJZ33_01440 [Paludibacteraceae bacterium]|nr:hypothetical protein [Paludibacteraceae bacterium]